MSIRPRLQIGSRFRRIFRGLPEIEDAYLRRLGLDREPPTVEALFRIHRAHLERVPYETTWIHLGEPWTVDPQRPWRASPSEDAVVTASI